MRTQFELYISLCNVLLGPILNREWNFQRRLMINSLFADIVEFCQRKTVSSALNTIDCKGLSCRRIVEIKFR